MKRRTLIKSIALSSIAFALRPVVAMARSQAEVEKIQQRWSEFLPKNFEPPSPSPAISRSKAQWRETLSPEAYDVLRKEATERPFSSPLDKEKREGVFACAGCELPLFTSEMKYDSGTGWPSFFTHIPGAMATKRDYKMIWPRTEYHCIRCGGHQGHVFDDGPAPTNERWCNNGVALRFLASAP